MILSRTPLRLCLGGGGTDVKAYYERFGGYLVSAALNQYIYIVIHNNAENDIRLCYSKREIVASGGEVKHPVVREAVKLFGIENEGGIEILSFADIGAETGLGSSSAFTVGLITALAAYKRRKMTKHEIAEMACRIERDILKEAGGKQDQYIASFGGITAFQYQKDGKVIVSPVEVSYPSIEKLERNIMLFFTGIKRNSPKVQSALVRNLTTKKGALHGLHRIKELGIQTEEMLRKGQIDRYADFLREHWEAKQKLSSFISNDAIGRLYDTAMKNGAMGGKLIGAGGGGYLLFYCSDPAKQLRISSAMKAEGAEQLHYRFDFTGSVILVDDGIRGKKINTLV